MSPKPSTRNQLQFDFEKPHIGLPAQDAFPLNRKDEQRAVSTILAEDFLKSRNFLVVTGYTSLSHLIEFFGKKALQWPGEKVRIVLGNEPDVRRRESWFRMDLSKEIKEYWLKEGFSIAKSGAIIHAIELIKERKIDFRLHNNLHAKIYVGESSAILGSSNFSWKGLNHLQEANVRFSSTSHDGFEAKRHHDTAKIAEQYFTESSDYNDEIQKLLSQLLDVTSWQEALSRAIAEMLECNSIDEYPDLLERVNSAKLWPSQKRALSQALNILQIQGNVLIAEPTGSGKTKLISILRLILEYWAIESGKKFGTGAVVICPPLVMSHWAEEGLNASFISDAQLSRGVLSNASASVKKVAERRIQKADILILDEAHSFLNRESERSKKIASNSARHTILSTATPINKKAGDLLRLIEILGVDNLNDGELKEYKSLYRKRSVFEKKNIDDLRSYIWKFTVRQTKKQLKRSIEENPDEFLDKHGRKCKFPETKSFTYPTGESADDNKIAATINKTLQAIKGISFLMNFDRPHYLPMDQEGPFINGRIRGARALSIFRVQSVLRSSRPALIEHIKGTLTAIKMYGFRSHKSSTGNMIGNLKKHYYKMPKIGFPKELFGPFPWLLEANEFKKACEEEIEIYEEVAELATKISDGRERAKFKKLVDLSSSHQKVLTFDGTVLTLDFLKHMANSEKLSTAEWRVVTGTSGSQSWLLREFLPDNLSKEGVVALCSDTVSEGVNLQLASALLFLDMPSVLRTAEQRIGRVDRLDSPHQKIEVYWPDDSKEFALKSDTKLLRTVDIAESLIGVNLEIPEKIRPMKAKEVIAAYHKNLQEEDSWEGLKDAFQPIQDLYIGKASIIKKDLYEQLKGVRATVKSKLSIVHSVHSWIFIAMKGNSSFPSRWFFIDHSGKLFTELSEICDLLRKELKGNPANEKKWTDDAENHLSRYLEILRTHEFERMSIRKRRALEVAKRLLGEWKKRFPTNQSILNNLLSQFKVSNSDEEESVDFNSFAQIWLDYFRPSLGWKRETNEQRKKLVTLSDLVNRLKTKEPQWSELQKISENIPVTQELGQSLAACILGLGSENDIRHQT